jgi:hypothetical protein
MKARLAQEQMLWGVEQTEVECVEEKRRVGTEAEKARVCKGVVIGAG